MPSENEWCKVAKIIQSGLAAGVTDKEDVARKPKGAAADVAGRFGKIRDGICDGIWLSHGHAVSDYGVHVWDRIRLAAS